MDVHISHLRKKLDNDEETLIQTVRGAGYLLAFEGGTERRQKTGEIRLHQDPHLVIAHAGVSLLGLFSSATGSRCKSASANLPTSPSLEFQEAQEAYEAGGQARRRR